MLAYVDWMRLICKYAVASVYLPADLYCMFWIIVTHKSGNSFLTNSKGTRVLSRISVNRNLSIIPSKIQISVLPFPEIPALLLDVLL
jgi:hypothetical protein